MSDIQHLPTLLLYGVQWQMDTLSVLFSAIQMPFIPKQLSLSSLHTRTAVSLTRIVKGPLCSSWRSSQCFFVVLHLRSLLNPTSFPQNSINLIFSGSPRVVACSLSSYFHGPFTLQSSLNSDCRNLLPKHFLDSQEVYTFPFILFLVLLFIYLSVIQSFLSFCIFISNLTKNSIINGCRRENHVQNISWKPVPNVSLKIS